MKSIFFTCGLAIAGLATAAGASLRYSVVAQTTPSMPYGVYLLDRGSKGIARGETVAVCPNDVARAYAQAHHLLGVGACPGDVAPLLKVAVAIPGDTVRFDRRGVSVNGQATLASSRAVAAYRASLSGTEVLLPSLAFRTYRVPAGEAWVWTPEWYSFDSRYYGPLRVVGAIRPLYTQSVEAQTQYTDVQFR